jgi:hypothetical protein
MRKAEPNAASLIDDIRSDLWLREGHGVVVRRDELLHDPLQDLDDRGEPPIAAAASVAVPRRGGRRKTCEGEREEQREHESTALTSGHTSS